MQLQRWIAATAVKRPGISPLLNHREVFVKGGNIPVLESLPRCLGQPAQARDSEGGGAEIVGYSR